MLLARHVFFCVFVILIRFDYVPIAHCKTTAPLGPQRMTIVGSKVVVVRAEWVDAVGKGSTVFLIINCDAFCLRCVAFLVGRMVSSFIREYFIHLCVCCLRIMLLWVWLCAHGNCNITCRDGAKARVRLGAIRWFLIKV